MSTYFVGDLQGCYRELDTLLTQVAFNPQHDQLICVGDLVARGPDSRKALECIIELGSAAQTVLGNHDLNLLAILTGLRKANPKDLLAPIIEAPTAKRDQWIDWLRQQPLLLSDSQTNNTPTYCVTHAGVYPWWTLAEAADYAAEVAAELRSEQFISLLQNMYGNKPSHWHSSLSGYDRYRFIVNAFTRMRFCRADGLLELEQKSSPHQATDAELQPWFNWWKPSSTKLIFGHWAALEGNTARTDVIALDTGCVWGNHLTLLRWPEQERITQPAFRI